MSLNQYLESIKLANNKHILDGIYYSMMNDNSITVEESQIICNTLDNREKELKVIEDNIHHFLLL